ncbi:MAG: hypothetical protein LBH61_04865 [Dysgonamonadaceae bacterium]|jgi:hypothetical protein|nr:hypothetical protein [Dysgonamonadaceae bacterium]
MKIRRLFLLKWKSFVRHPLLEQTLLFRFLAGAYLLSSFYVIYRGGFFLDDFSRLLFPAITNPVNVFLISILSLLLPDFVLKFMLKKDRHPFISIRRFPGSAKSVSVYLVVNELFRFWNYYLLFFFSAYLTTNIYPQYGLSVTLGSFAIVYAAQVLVSQLIIYIKQSGSLFF